MRIHNKKILIILMLLLLLPASLMAGSLIMGGTGGCVQSPAGSGSLYQIVPGATHYLTSGTDPYVEAGGSYYALP